MFNKQIFKGHFKQRSKTNTNPFVILFTWHQFGGKTNWFGTKKKTSLKENSWFGESKCKLGSKVVHVFAYCSLPLIFLPLLLKFCENGRHVMD